MTPKTYCIKMSQVYSIVVVSNQQVWIVSTESCFRSTKVNSNVSI